MSMSFARKAVFRMLENVRHGALELICPERTYLFGQGGTGLRASIAVHDERFFSRVLWGGDDAAGDSYMDGDWTSPDLVAVVRLAARNLLELESGNPLLSLANRLFHRLRHWMNRNTLAGSRRNIQAHYDLSNDFFRLFLDRNMVYSSAVYRYANDSLEEAQIEKARPDLPQAASGTRGSCPRNWHWLGRLCLARLPQLRMPGYHDHYQPRAA